jgi:hypothetical protein
MEVSATESCFALMQVTLHSFSLDPLTNVRGAILELDAIRFTALKKSDSVSIHQGQVFQVQHYAATFGLGLKLCF